MFKKDLKIEDIYQRVKQIPKDIRFLAGMCNLIWEQGAEYLSYIKEQTCLQNNPPPEDSAVIPTEYDFRSFEYPMWMTSLTSICWLLTNVKKKTENGHYHNPIHNEMIERTGCAGCNVASTFHSRFYDALIDSLDGLVTYARKQRPTDLTSNPG